ncbi:MAG TPA: DUF885 domain-containing protein [Deltaproteobacteria bacterium]|nr:DUF885 domain-containing protein [Deltaproteobacteria bacterium]
MVALLLTLACTPKPPRPPITIDDPGVLGADDPAVAGIDSPLLRMLVADRWEATLARHPTWASELGDRRFDDQLFDASLPAHSAWLRREQGWALRASTLPDAALSPSDRLTRDLMLEELRTSLALEVCRLHLWSLSPRGNALVWANHLAEAPRLETPGDIASLLARYRALPTLIEDQAANLKIGHAEGRIGNAASLERVIAMIEAQLALPVEEDPLFAPAVDADAGLDQPEGWRGALRSTIEQEIRPALEGYLEVVRSELLPDARSGDQIGLHALPDGDACYDALIRSHTTTDEGADALHALGLASLESIHGEIRALGERVLGTGDPQEIFEQLRTDPQLRFETSGEVQATAEAALARAQGALPGWFGRLPRAECVVEPVPDYLAPYTTVAYYQPARPDGTRPGTYFVNVLDPQTRPRYEAEVLAFHESIPGHHLQIAIAQELDELPLFRRHGSITAFVEGWGLYAERLADEMGLYSGDLDRMGMLSFDAWRAARLVVDTGIHARGWSRAEAEAFLMENTPLAQNNVINEVDRYINTPGQALAYKVGQLEILAIRARAEAALGDSLELAAFHDAILDDGPLPLALLAERMDTWIAETADAAGLDTSSTSQEAPK